MWPKNMKKTMKKVMLLVALCVMTVAGYAHEPSKAERAIGEIVKKYENTKGVDSMSVVKGKGFGFGFVKMMFTAQFGKEFMKGVTSITVIDYGDASEEVCIALRKELDVFKSMLEEFEMGEKDKEKELESLSFLRSFASVSKEDKTISDFIIAAEEKDSKMIMYMAGKIKVEE